MENFINEILDELLPALSIDANSGLARPIAQAILHNKISNRLEQLIMSEIAEVKVGQYTITPMPIPGASQNNIFLQNSIGEGTGVDLDWLWKNTF